MKKKLLFRNNDPKNTKQSVQSAQDETCLNEKELQNMTHNIIKQASEKNINDFLHLHYCTEKKMISWKPNQYIWAISWEKRH